MEDILLAVEEAFVHVVGWNLLRTERAPQILVIVQEIFSPNLDISASVLAAISRIDGNDLRLTCRILVNQILHQDSI